MKNNDITVILTLYKRPSNLEKQLDAIQNQSVKPYQIWLFQDKVEDGEIIEIPDSIKHIFDRVVIMDKNKGVWGRFELAKEVSSKYVCLFDDDVIPGKKWLENCLNQISTREGLYGTNGVVLIEPKNYPYRDYYNEGVYSQNKETIEVDFVGHSWFLKSNWINYMFEGTEEIQNLKIAGEDMALSAKLQEKGIKTFVPPHPPTEIELWGELPNLCKHLVQDKNAVSSNQVALNKFNIGLKLLINMGYTPLIYKKTKHKIYKIIWISMRYFFWLFIRSSNIRKTIKQLIMRKILINEIK